MVNVKGLAPGATRANALAGVKDANLTSDRLAVQNSGTRECGLGFVSSMPPFARFVAWPGRLAQDAAYPGSDRAARAPLFGEIDASKCWNILSTLARGFNNGIGFAGA